MARNIIDGLKVAEILRQQVREDVQEWVGRGNRHPMLQVVLIGNDPASKTYVGAKTKACNEVGIHSQTISFPDTMSIRELREAIHSYNNDDNIDGILLQLPLPSHLHSSQIIETIDFRKDVDGFHPMNVGRLAVGQPTFRSCTPAGILELFRYYSVMTKGKHAVVIGASNIVGSPLAIMLSRENETGKATTTLCHKYTRDITRHTIQADILVVAVGSPGLITGQMVKEGVIVVDVGINRVSDSNAKNGYRLVGDCDFDSVSEKASLITPVPGGVGPMTVAMLMKNTLLAAKKSIYPSDHY